MNAVEQMMQSFSISSQPQLTALFSSAAQQAGEAGDLASQFAALIQNSGATLVADNTEFQIVEPTKAGSYIVEGVSEAAALPDFLAGLNPSDITLNTEKAAEVPSGIPGLQLVQLTGLELNKLVESGQIQQVPTATPTAAGAAQPALAPDETDLFLFAAGTPNGAGSNDIHLLPLAQLEALTNPAPKEAPSVAPLVASSAQAVTPTSGKIAEPAAGTFAPSLETAAPKTAETIAAVAVEQATAKEPATAQLPTQAERLEAAAKQAAQATGQKPEDADNAEGHAVAAGAASKKAANANNTTNQAANAQQNQVASQQASATVAPAAQAQTQATKSDADKPLAKDNSKATAAQTAAQAPQMAPARAAAQAAQQPVVTWTPEQIAGGDGTAPEVIASGLGGLKGESSFMGSMGLLGGKTSPALGAHIAKQLNLSMSRALKSGDSEFSMRMDPAELGRVKVKLTFGADGMVTAKVMAERPETLELLQRETRSLERAMEAGGHKSADGGIQFSLDTGDGESAGKAFAEAVQQENAQDRKSAGGHLLEDELLDEFEEMDEATLNEILANVTPETGLDVRV